MEDAFHLLSLRWYSLMHLIWRTQDGYLLGRLLTHPLTTRTTIDKVLHIYESIRMPFSNKLVCIAHDLGKLYEFGGVDMHGDGEVNGDGGEDGGTSHY